GLSALCIWYILSHLFSVRGYSTPDSGRSLRSLGVVASFPGSGRPLCSGRLQAAAKEPQPVTLPNHSLLGLTGITFGSGLEPEHKRDAAESATQPRRSQPRQLPNLQLH